MKIGKFEIVSGPNVYWYFLTIIFWITGGWKGLLIWAGINLFFIGLALAVNKSFREEIFKKKS